MHKFLIILMSDDSPSFCHYENKMDSHKLLSLDNLKEAIRFSMKENMSIQIILPKHQLPDEYLEQIPPNTVLIASYDSCYANQADALVFQSVKEFNEYFPDKEQVCVLLLKHYDLDSLLTIKEQNLLGIKRLVIALQGIKGFNSNAFDKYKSGLNSLSIKLESVYKSSGNITVNVLSDILFADKMNNCNAGIDSVTVAPNGRLYLCPAFYYDSKESSIGDCVCGITLKNRHLLELESAPICRICDVYHCRRCIWLNQKLTGELNTPSKQQCILSHIERNQGKELLSRLRKLDPSFASGRIIKDIEYLDPFELISR